MIITNVGKIIMMYQALDEIRGQKINKTHAKQLHDMRKRADETIDFYNEQQKEIVERLKIEVKPDGRLHFGDDVEKFQQYQKEMDEVNAVNVEFNCEKIDLSEEDISCSEVFIDATEDFILL